MENIQDASSSNSERGDSPVFAHSPRRGDWLLFVAILLATVALSVIVYKITDQNAQQRFEYRTEQERNRILFRMAAHAQVLRGAAALFESSSNVSREEFRNYVANLELEKTLPGIQGTGFTQMIAPQDKAGHEGTIRRSGYPDYTIHPAGSREQYSSIVYLEPFSGRNLKAFGFDMYSEPIRRTAMERARDNGEPALSGKVTLVQEDGQDVQPGFLIYAPIYRGAPRPETTEQRRAALVGFAYSPFRAHDLLSSVITKDNKDVELLLYDTAIDPKQLLFDSHPESLATGGRHHVELPIDFGGHRWIARFESRAEFDRITASELPMGIALGGTLLALMTLFWQMRSRKLQESITRHAEQLRGNEARLRTLIDTMPDMVCLKDGQNRLIEANSVFIQLFGLQEISYRGKTGKELARAGRFDHARLAKLDLADERAWQRGEHCRDELIITHPSAQERVFELSTVPIFGPDGSRQALANVGHEITERIATEKAIRAAEHKFRGLVEQSLVGVYIIQNGYFRYVNPHFATIFGYSAPEDLIDAVPVIELVAPADRTKVADNIRRRLQGEIGTLHYSFVGMRQDGQSVDIEVFGTSVDYEERPAVIGVLLDISERVRAETELKRHRDHLEDEVASRTAQLRVAKEAAEAANRAKTTFLANMSHELRTPMNAIIGLTHILNQKSQDSAQREKLGKIGAAADHLLRLINDILDITRIEAEQLPLEHIPLNLGLMIRALEPLTGERIREKGLTYRQEFSPRLSEIPLLGDPLRLRQILTNLLDNAMKFTTQGGIALSARITNETARQVTLSIAISDTGSGIPADAHSRIFMPFEQADGSMTRKHGGSGLGLTIVRQLARMMRGDITVSSELGKGSTFTVTLCLDKSPDAAAQT